jgi:HK97 family phage major capsid protein
MMQLDKKPLIDSARDLAKTDKSYQATVDFIESKTELRAMSASSMTAGGALIPPELAAELVELLYARTVVMGLGARTMDFTSSINLGKINSGATVYYVGEAANITPSQPGFGELRMTGKKAAALVSVTNELLRNPSVGADTIVRDDLLQAMALRRDLSALRGTGDSGQPKGITKFINASNVFNSTGTTTAQKVADLTKAIRLVDESNVPLDSGGWCMSPRSKWSLFATLDANSNFVFAAQLAMGMLLGFPARSTTQVPNNLGGGSDSEVYFGAWNDLIIGFDKTTPMQVEAFPNGAYFDGAAVVSGISNDTTPIRLMEAHDVLARHDNTFARIDAVGWL